MFRYRGRWPFVNFIPGVAATLTIERPDANVAGRDRAAAQRDRRPERALGG